MVRSWVTVTTQPLGFSKMQGLKSLTLHWRSFLGWGKEHVVRLFGITPPNTYRMWQCSILTAECVRLKIADTLLTLSLITSIQTSYTHGSYVMKRILIIDIQQCVWEYYHLHPAALIRLNFWSTSIHVVRVRNDVVLSHSCACGQQITACRSFH